VRERSEFVIDCEAIAARLSARDLTLLDVRDTDEHAGRDKTACGARHGCIPGLVWIEWTEPKVGSLHHHYERRVVCLDV